MTASMFAYQKTGRYFAQIARGLEPEGAAELTALGGDDVKTAFMGVYFSADSATLYRANYLSRLCTRILAPLLTFDCHSTKYLYQTARKIDWHLLLSERQTFAVKASVAASAIKHSRYAALCLKDAVVDHFRDRCGIRPNIDTTQPDLWLNLRIDRNKATISVDTSGGSLHRRGYRKESVEAPMQETLAAAIISLSGWNGEMPLLDPLCGSGTLLCEALIHHCRIPAGFLRRRFGFESLPDFDAGLWQQVKSEANAAIRRPAKGLLAGSDMDPAAVKAARANLSLLPHGDTVPIAVRDFRQIRLTQQSVLVTNPPYGIRLHDKKDGGRLLRDLGAYIRRESLLIAAFLYLGAAELTGQLGGKPLWQKTLFNGGLEGRLLCLKKA
ncbi:MAG: THUMP domain-containing class I SAM-dependent RNA methyltransferase [Thermodesulfobacteriota bacterium]